MLWSALHHRRQVLPRGDAPLLPSLQHRLLAELRVPVHLDSRGVNTCIAYGHSYSINGVITSKSFMWLVMDKK